MSTQHKEEAPEQEKPKKGLNLREWWALKSPVSPLSSAVLLPMFGQDSKDMPS